MNFTKKEFVNPPKEYSMVPFWFWNDELEPKHLCWQLDQMVEKGVFECIIHSRKGVTVKYLSDTWFERINIVLDYAKKLGMRLWIYDEDNWPSGYAGGKVIDLHPEYSAKCLSREKIYPVLGEDIVVPEIPNKKILAVVAVYKNEKFYDLTDYENGGFHAWHSETLSWEVFVFRIEDCDHRPTYSNTPYIDLLNHDAVECFIDVTHKEYKRRCKKHWGKTIKGFFTDEPGFYQNYTEQGKNIGTIIWTESFPDYFKKLYGYDIVPYLCSLWEDMGDVSRKTRHDYYDAISKMYSENFFKQIYDFCEKDGLQNIGHIHQEEHLYKTVQMESHFFRAMKYLHVPGIDKIDKEMQRVTEKLGSSASHLTGKERCFSETYGCFGWELTPQEMKTQADRQFVQGINMLIPHAFFSSTEGIRAQESPPSEFYQNAYWRYFSQFANYIHRLSYICSCGKPQADILVYYPITSAWEKFEPLNKYEVHKLDESFISVSNLLQNNQLDFEYIDDDSLQNSSLESNKLEIKNILYKAIILPKITSLPLESLKKILLFSLNGGVVISVGGIPPYSSEVDCDEEFLSILQKLQQSKTFYTVAESALCDILNFISEDMHTVTLANKDDRIMVMHREDETHDVFFLVNTSEHRLENCINFLSKGIVELWNPVDGMITKLDSIYCKGKTSIALQFEPYDSKLIVVKKQMAEPCKIIELSNNYNINVSNMPLLTKPDMTLSQKCNNISTAHKIIESSVLAKEINQPLNTTTSVSEQKSSFSRLGLNNFSGLVTYEKTFTINELYKKIILDLGDVKDFASITLNGRLTITKLWQPYTYNITPAILLGVNNLSITVGNTMSNYYNNTNLPAGLMSKIRLILTNE